MRSSDPEVTAPTAETVAEAPQGQMVGRYLLLQRLGGGGGGEVYAAFDPVLDRKVALKFLHHTEAAGPALIREGRLLAKVSHHAVVEVHEVAFHEGRAYMAMELVAGGDLESFAAEARARSDVRAILAALCSVAEGIIAAHEAGVVHGDIKPSNVLRTVAGKFKVSDFGIARVRSADEDGGPGKPIGTPAFMAPEQHAGVHPDERSDQFAFCVTAWVVLSGALPFQPTMTARSTTNDSADATGPIEDLETVKAAGAPSWPSPAKVPRYVGEVLRRGLRPDPDERWPSMAALLRALRPSPARARMRRLAVGGAAVTLAAASVYGYQRWDHASRVAQCDSEGASIEEVWNKDTDAAMREALVATGLKYAGATADKVRPWLDEWARTWTQQRVTTCTHRLVEEDWGDDLAARATWCLDQRRLEFEAAIGQLREADAGTVERAVALGSGLPQTLGCTDPVVLAAQPDPPDASTLSTTTALLSEIERARALDKTGKYAEGLEVAQAARERVGDSSPLYGRALLAEGKLLWHAGKPADAEKALLEAYVTAASTRNWSVAAVAAEDLIYIVGRVLDRPKEGESWETHALVAARLGGDPLDIHEAGRVSNMAVLKRLLAEYDESVELHHRALALTRAAYGDNHPVVAAREGNLGAVYIDQGKYAKALEQFEKVAELRTKTLGPHHPLAISSLSNIAVTYGQQGEFRKAAELLEEVLARREVALGKDHLDVAGALDNLAAMLIDLGDKEPARRHLERALAIKQAAQPDGLEVATTLMHLARAGAEPVPLLERALAIRVRILGEDHHKVADTLINLGTEHFIAGDLDRAREQFARAHRSFERAFGTEHPRTAAAVNNLGDVALETGHYDEATKLYAQAHAVWKKTLGPNHPHTATALAHWGTTQLRAGRREEAKPLLEQAIASFEAGEGGGEQEATAHFDLAKALVQGPEAVAHAERAKAILDEIGGGEMLTVDDIDQWLSER